MYTNRENIALPLAVWLAADYGYDLAFDPKVFSATTLLKSTKSIVLSRQLMTTGTSAPKDLDDLVASRVGTAVHIAAETAWENSYGIALDRLGYPKTMVDNVRLNPVEIDQTKLNIFMERRSAKQIGGYTISGKFDFVIDGRVRDIKTTKTYSWIKGSNNKKYALQGSIYRWLNQDIIVDDFVDIDYVFTDWTPVGLKKDPKVYPPSRILTKSLPLLSIAATEEFLLNKLADIEKCAKLPEAQMPACTPTELWMNPSTWAYFPNPAKYHAAITAGEKPRAYRVFDLAADANAMNSAGKGLVIERKGIPRFCSYCDARANCSQASKFILDGLLEL